MNRRQQRGMTFTGWLLVLVIFGIFALAALRLVPIYLEYYRINSVLSSLKVEMVDSSPSKKDIKSFLDKRFNIESIARIKPSDIKITPKSETWEVRANYDARTEFIGNLHFIVTFDKVVEIKR